MTFHRRALAAAVSIPLFSSPLLAAGLDYPWSSTSSMGTAGANAAEAADPSTIYANPAGITRFHHRIKSDSFQGLNIQGKFRDEGSTKANGNPSVDDNNNGQIDGSEGANLNGGSYHPKLIGGGQLFVALPKDDMVTLGFGLFVPYGANINYKNDWAGRYNTDRGAIESVILNPMAAIRFDDKHSVAVGADVQLMHVNLKIGVDIREGISQIGQQTISSGNGTPLGALAGPFCQSVPAACRTLGDAVVGSQGGYDVNGVPWLNVEGFSIGLGYNLGYMFTMDDRTRFSLGYRSAIAQTVHARADWNFDAVSGALPNPSNPTQGVDAKTFIESSIRPDTDATIRIKTPDSLIAGVFHQLNEKIDLMATATFTGYSSIDELRVRFEDRTAPGGSTVKQGDGVSRTQFRDTIKVAVGANYRLNDRVMLRTGFAFDQTPVRGPENRSAAAPDANRYVYTVGMNYRINSKFTADLAYGLIFLEDARANYTDQCTPAGFFSPDGTTANADTSRPNACTGNGGTIKGLYYDTVVQSLGAQLNHKF